MKKGFTLQELLITLGIIGIVAAVCAPAITNMFPNKYKSKYMKAYSTLTRTVSDMIDDEELFPTKYYTVGEHAGEVDEAGFANTDSVTNIAPFNDSSSIYHVGDDNCKFDKIFAYKLNLNTTPNLCKTGSRTSDFRTPDGTEWNIKSKGMGGNVFIAIDVDPDKEAGKGTYSDANTNPHVFTFLVLKDGGIRATDAMGCAYLENATDMNNSSSDSENAKTKLTELNSQENENEIKNLVGGDGFYNSYKSFMQSFSKCNTSNSNSNGKSLVK